MRRRALALLLGLPFLNQAHAQVTDYGIQNGIRALRDKGLLPPLSQTNPTQPTGNPLPPIQRQGDLPRPGPLGPEGGSLKLLQSGTADYSNPPFIHVTDGVEFTDRGYHCWADEVYGDRRTDTYTLKGNVRVLGEDASIYGDTVQVNFTNKTFVAEGSESTIKPGLMKGFVRGNLYIKAAQASGSQREIFAEHSSTTTCDYPRPHFELQAEKVDVRTNVRVIFHKVKIKILGRTVLNLPFLSVPIDERTYNNLPVVGRGTVEGYFIKSRYSFPLTGRSVVNTRLDYFSRLGMGVGAGIRYDNPDMRGTLSFYTIEGPHREFEFLGQHRQNFHWGTLTLDSTYEDDNYLISAASKTLNTRAVLYIPRGRSSNRITFFQATGDSLGSTTRSQTISVNDTETWNSKLRTTFDVNLSSNSSSFTGGQPIHREQADVAFHAIDNLGLADARLDYVRSIPIGVSSNFFATSDVTPSLSFASSSRQLFGLGAETRFPFTVQLGYGEYGDPIHQGRLTRADFDFTFQNPRKESRHWDLNYQGEFKQDVYSDDTAQYVLRGASQLTYNFKNNSRFNITYNYLRPEGFTPLQIDRRGQQNSFISDLSVSPFRGMLIGAATGYDFNLTKQHQPTPWQQVGLQARYTVNKTFDFRALSTYDTIRHTYSSTRLDLTWIPGSTYFSFGAKYDGVRHSWAAANVYIDGLQWGRLRTSVLLNYNGYTRQFEAQHYSFIYDLHCAEAVLQFINNPTGFNSGKQIYFFIRLKALPFDTPFGTGQRGQPIGTGTGRD
jgi:hypothetical protein